MSGEDPIAAFRVEAVELLDSVEHGLLDLGHRLDDMNLVNAVFRGLHTLKGSGAMFGFDALAAFTHHCESAFDRVRKGEVPATPELVSVILSAGDHMRALVDGDAPVAEGDAILASLSDAVNAARGIAPGTDPASTPDVSPVAAPATAGGTTGQRGWSLSFALPTDAMANGTNPLALLDELRALGDCTVTARCDTIPPLDQLDPTQCHIGWDVTLIGDISRDDIDDVFIFVMDDMTLDITALAGDTTEASDAPAAEIVPETAVDLPVTETDSPATVTSRTTSKAAGDSVRIPAERLDELMDRVGELVIAQSRLSQIADHGTDLALYRPGVSAWTCNGFCRSLISLCHLGFECERACAAQLRMPPAGIVKPIEVLKNCGLRLPPGRPTLTPHKFSLKGFEEGFYRGPFGRLKTGL